MSKFNQVRNSILGFIIGDAVGVPYEFMSRETLKKNPALDMIEYGTHNQPIGTWSDDTSMMLILIQWLIDCKKKGLQFDEYGYDEYQKLKDTWRKWKNKGHCTPHGECFDIGGQTRRALEAVELYSDISLDPTAQGNGAMMRCLPFGLLHNKTKTNEYLYAMHQVLRMSSKITHGSAVSNCYIKDYVNVVSMLMRLIPEGNKARLLTINEVPPGLNNGHVVETYRSVADSLALGDYNNEVNDRFYIPVSEIQKTPSEYFKKTILYSINLGEDTDTVAALTGGMAGVMFTGENDLPQDWLSKIVKLDDIENLIKLFYETFQEEIEG